jgi:hypothetical protein
VFLASQHLLPAVCPADKQIIRNPVQWMDIRRLPGKAARKDGLVIPGDQHSGGSFIWGLVELDNIVIPTEEAVEFRRGWP